MYFDPTKWLNLLQESYFVYDKSSFVKLTFITEINKFLSIYCSASNFSEKKQDKSKIISPVNQKSLTIGKNIRKKQAKPSNSKSQREKIETMDKKFHNLQLT